MMASQAGEYLMASVEWALLVRPGVFRCLSESLLDWRSDAISGSHAPVWHPSIRNCRPGALATTPGRVGIGVNARQPSERQDMVRTNRDRSARRLPGRQARRRAAHPGGDLSIRGVRGCRGVGIDRHSCRGRSITSSLAVERHTPPRIGSGVIISRKEPCQTRLKLRDS
jgi:hypothetical protein